MAKAQRLARARGVLGELEHLLPGRLDEMAHAVGFADEAARALGSERNGVVFIGESLDIAPPRGSPQP
jgi:hypothetical protein